jgi:hypothetical protein
MNEEPEPKLPVELVANFSRCINYPRDKAGIQIFAQELSRASSVTGVPMESIVLKCREVADVAPEYADMVQIGREIAADQSRKDEASRSQRREWESQYGKPEPFKADWTMEDVKKSREQDRLMWARIKTRLADRFKGGNKQFDFSKATWGQVYRAKRELGYPLTPYEEKWIA